MHSRTMKQVLRRRRFKLLPIASIKCSTISGAAGRAQSAVECDSGLRDEAALYPTTSMAPLVGKGALAAACVAGWAALRGAHAQPSNLPTLGTEFGGGPFVFTNIAA